MNIIYKYIFLIFISSITCSSLSFNVGKAKPLGLLPEYSDKGSHYKITFEKEIDNRSVNDLYIGYSGQYIYFGQSIVEEDIWSDLYAFDPNDELKIFEGERSLMFDVGLKKKWNPQDKNLYFYFGGSAGIAFFRQYTLFDYPNTYNSCSNNSLFDVDSLLDFIFWLIDDDNFNCAPSVDENKVYETKDKKISPYMSVDAGLGFYVNNSETLFFDVGLSYSMFTNIDVLEYKDYQDNAPPIFNDIGKVIGADYRTLFIGITYEF